MIEERPLTSIEELIDIMQRDDEIWGISRADYRFHIETFVTEAHEYWVDGVLGGFVLVFDYFGAQSLHGYNLTNSHAIEAFHIFKRMARKYPKAFITLTRDKIKVIRLIGLLGFKETGSIVHNGIEILKMER